MHWVKRRHKHELNPFIVQTVCTMILGRTFWYFNKWDPTAKEKMKFEKIRPVLRAIFRLPWSQNSGMHEGFASTLENYSWGKMVRHLPKPTVHVVAVSIAWAMWSIYQKLQTRLIAMQSQVAHSSTKNPQMVPFLQTTKPHCLLPLP